MDRRPRRTVDAASRSASPSPSTAPTRRGWRPHAVARRRRVGHQRREDVEHRHPRRAVRPDLRPHERQGGRRHGHHRVPRADRQPGLRDRSSSCGRSTCRPTTRTSGSPTCACPTAPIFGGEGRGLQVVQHFFNENRIRQAASSLGAAQFCIDEAVEVRQASARRSASRSSTNQAIQFPLVELQTQCEMLRALIHKTAWPMDTVRRVLGVRQGLDVQLLGQPAVLRGGRPGDAGARRPRLLAAQAVRAHLPPPPPLPHHRGQRGDPDAPRRRLPVRLHEPAGAEGRGRRAARRPPPAR